MAAAINTPAKTSAPLLAASSGVQDMFLEAQNALSEYGKIASDITKQIGDVEKVALDTTQGRDLAIALYETAKKTSTAAQIALSPLEITIKTFEQAIYEVNGNTKRTNWLARFGMLDEVNQKLTKATEKVNEMEKAKAAIDKHARAFNALEKNLGTLLTPEVSQGSYLGGWEFALSSNASVIEQYKMIQATKSSASAAAPAPQPKAAEATPTPTSVPSAAQPSAAAETPTPVVSVPPASAAAAPEAPTAALQPVKLAAASASAATEAAPAKAPVAAAKTNGSKVPAATAQERQFSEKEQMPKLDDCIKRIGEMEARLLNTPSSVSADELSGFIANRNRFLQGDGFSGKSDATDRYKQKWTQASSALRSLEATLQSMNTENTDQKHAETTNTKQKK